jgi:uncharacterized protein YbaP (TraB family)
MKKFIAIIAVVCLGSVCLFGETSVWKVSNGGNVLYIGGTIHVLRESDYPLPESFNAAFNKSEIIIFETSLDDPLELLSNGEIKSFMEECEQINIMVNENDNVRRLIDLGDEFSTLTAPHENVYNSLSDPAIRLTSGELEIRDQMISILFNVQVLLQDEQVKIYIERTQKILAAAEENELINSLFNMIMNPGFKSLDTILSKETFKLLTTICERVDYPIAEIRYLRPYIAYSRLSIHILNQFARADGVDVFFMKKAKEHGKKVEYLETPEFQYNLISNLGNEYGDSYYAYIFQELESGEDAETAFDRMIDYWKKGQEDDELMLYERENFPAVYEAMITNRNKAWISIIKNYLHTPSTEFILVGNGHMHGPDGLLTQLQKMGYKIEQN